MPIKQMDAQGALNGPQEAPQGNTTPPASGMTEDDMIRMQGQMTQQDQAYINGLMKMLHSPKTGGKVVEMLKSAPPEKSIPQAAMMINGQFEAMLGEKGQKASLETRLMGGVYLVSDLVEIGDAAAAWEQPLDPENDLPLLLEGTIQMYIEKGLADGTIDPIELQQKVEPLMSDEHRQLGLEAANMTGIPTEPDQSTAMEAYASQRERKVMDKASNQQANSQRSQMMQGGK